MEGKVGGKPQGDPGTCLPNSLTSGEEQEGTLGCSGHAALSAWDSLCESRPLEADVVHMMTYKCHHTDDLCMSTPCVGLVWVGNRPVALGCSWKKLRPCGSRVSALPRVLQS